MLLDITGFIGRRIANVKTFKTKGLPLYKKIFYSFAVISLVLLTGFLVLYYIQMKDHIRQNFIESTITRMSHLKESADNFIVKLAEDEIVYTLNTDPEIRKLFVADLENDSVTISRAYDTLSRIVSSRDIIHSIFIYFSTNQLILSDLGAIFPHSKNEKFYNLPWLMQPENNRWYYIENFLNEVNYPEDVNVFMLKKSYPISARDLNHFRGCYIVCLNAGKMLRTIKNLGVNYFEDINVYNQQTGTFFGSSYINESIAESFSQPASEAGWLEFPDDPSRRICYAKSAYAPIYYTAEIEFNNSDIISVMINKNIGIFFIIIIFILIFISIFFEKWLYQPIKKILTQSHTINQQILGGDIDEPNEDKLLNRTLTQLVNKIRELETDITFDEPELRNAFVRKLIHNSIGTSEKLSEYMSRLNMEMPFRFFWCIKLCSGNDKDLSKHEMDSLRFNLIYFIENIHNALCVKIAADVFEGLGCMIVNSDSEEQVKRLCSNIRQHAVSRLHLDVAFVIGSREKKIEHCHVSYLKAKANGEYLFFLPHKKILGTEELKPIISNNDTDLVPLLDSTDCLNNFENTDSVFREIKAAFDKIEDSPFELSSMKKLMDYLEAFLLEKTDKYVEFGIKPWRSFENINRYLEYIKDICRQIDVMQNNLQKSKSYRMIKKISGYIKGEIEHNPENVALKTVSDTFSLNPNYLSHIFKKYHHTSFKDFITELKLEKAKNMLIRENGLPVYEIANHIGYYNTSHFISIFKERYGMTPNDYRNKPKTTT